MIARTDKRLLGRWLALAGEGEDAFVIGHTLTSSGAKLLAGKHPLNRGPEYTCPECNGIGILLSDGGPSGPNGDECFECEGECVTSDLLPHALQLVEPPLFVHQGVVREKPLPESGPRNRPSPLANAGDDRPQD